MERGPAGIGGDVGRACVRVCSKANKRSKEESVCAGSLERVQ